MTKLKIAIVDDELLFIQGMKLILEQNEMLEVTNTAKSGLELLGQLNSGEFEADIVLLDLSMPEMDGIDTLLKLNTMNVSVQVIILTSHYNDAMIVKLLDEGVAGFLAKNEDPQEVINTILKVGEKGFHINDHILQLIRNRRLLAKKNKLSEHLSPREIEILKLICQEHTNKEIAQKLFLSTRTIEGHRNRMLLKTQSKNTAGLVLYAVINNIVTIDNSKYS